MSQSLSESKSGAPAFVGKLPMSTARAISICDAMAESTFNSPNAINFAIRPSCDDRSIIVAKGLHAPTPPQFVP